MFWTRDIPRKRRRGCRSTISRVRSSSCPGFVHGPVLKRPARSMQVSATTRVPIASAHSHPRPLPSQVKSLSRNTSFSGNLKGAKSVTDIEQIQHSSDPSDDRQVIRLPRPCSRQNNASRSTTDMPRSVSFSNEEGRHRQCASALKRVALATAIPPIASPAVG